MDVFIGFIASFGFNYAPRNWSSCQGQLFNIADNSALFALVQTFYGGDGRITGGIPELRGRTAIGFGAVAGIANYPIGYKTGSTSHTIQTTEMPSHTHVATVTGGGTAGTPAEVQVSTVTGKSLTPAEGDYLANGNFSGRGEAQIYIPAADKGATVKLGGVTGGGGSGGAMTVTNSIVGSSHPISLMQPYLAINYSMAVLGIFPSRN